MLCSFIGKLQIENVRLLRRSRKKPSFHIFQMYVFQKIIFLVSLYGKYLRVSISLSHIHVFIHSFWFQTLPMLFFSHLWHSLAHMNASFFCYSRPFLWNQYLLNGNLIKCRFSLASLLCLISSEKEWEKNIEWETRIETWEILFERGN